jgi:acyl-CoA thioester hydrolase
MTTVSKSPKDYRFQTQVRVRLPETDAVGIVYFGNYSVYMDVGRMDYLDHLDLNRADWPIKDLTPGAVVSSSMNFQSPARYNDVIDVHVKIANLGGSSYTFHVLFTHGEEERVLATGQLTLVWLDEHFKVIQMPDDFRDPIQNFEAS